MFQYRNISHTLDFRKKLIDNYFKGRLATTNLRLFVDNYEDVYIVKI